MVNIQCTKKSTGNECVTASKSYRHNSQEVIYKNRCLLLQLKKVTS